MKAIFQINSEGRFRILLESDDGIIFAEGDWVANYSSLATLTYEGRLFIAGTAYGLLPQAETVYEVNALPTTLDNGNNVDDAEPITLRQDKRIDQAGIDARWSEPGDQLD